MPDKAPSCNSTAAAAGTIELGKTAFQSGRFGPQTRRTMDRILFLIPYFGAWPPWINHFVETCRTNRTIDWILIGDSPAPENTARNVRHLQMEFADYKHLVAKRLGIAFDPAQPYKLCDIRPALGLIHADLARGYDFIGFGDIDVIYGDLRAFFDPLTLSLYDVFSSHADRISGHLCLMRNTPEVTQAFMRARGWAKSLGRREYSAFDEQGFYRVFRPARRDLIGRLTRNPHRVLFRETYSTPGPTQRMAWYWQDGRLTNEFYPHHALMYLHFMSWHSNRWYSSQPHVAPGAQAPWNKLPHIVQADWRRARANGFMISPAGIGDIVRSSYP